MKKSASSKVIPIAANTTANVSSGIAAQHLAPDARSAPPGCACGRPLTEKIGSFWPRTRVFRPSMAEMPVCMNSAGVVARRRVNGRTVHIQSAFRRSLRGHRQSGGPCRRIRAPSISGDTASSMLRPRKAHLAGLDRLMPWRAFKQLHQRLVAVHLQHAAAALSRRLPAQFRPARRTLRPLRLRPASAGLTTSSMVVYSFSIVKLLLRQRAFIWLAFSCLQYALS